MKAIEKELKAWAMEYRKESFTDEVRKAINLATYDLWYSAPSDGSVNDPPTDEYGNENEWSGYDFVKACKLIKDACEEVPSELWIDIDAEMCWQTEEPTTTKCDECDDGFHINESWQKVICEYCDGTGWVEPAGSWYRVKRIDLLNALVGKALAEHL